MRLRKQVESTNRNEFGSRVVTVQTKMVTRCPLCGKPRPRNRFIEMSVGPLYLRVCQLCVATGIGFSNLVTRWFGKTDR